MLAAMTKPGLIPYVLFESPGWAMFTLALCFAVTRILGRRMGNKRLIHLSWIAAGLIALLFATSYFVTTKREKLTVALKELLLAIEDKDFDTARKLVTEKAKVAYSGEEKYRPPYMDAEMDREKMIGLLNQVEFNDILLMSSVAYLDTQPDIGTTAFRVNVNGSLNGFPGISVSDWAIHWKYVDGKWVATGLECIDMGADSIFKRRD